MGQYYLIVNIDKKQYIKPHNFGDGLKLMEFGPSRCGTMCGLAILLADGNGMGGGDLQSDNPIIGSWAGDRIVICGDYAGVRKIDDKEVELYSYASDNFENISEKVRQAMSEDEWLAEDMREPW